MSTLSTRSAEREATGRRANPVIVIPGLLGSNLVIPGSNRSVWGAFDEGVIDPNSDEGAQLFAFPMEPGRSLDALEARSRADGTLGVVKGRVAGIPIRVKAYGDVMSAMGVSSYSETFARKQSARRDDVAYEFAYDFRRSIDDLACRLEAFMLQATRFLQLQRGNHDPIRFDVVAHSQGGLVLRYFLRYGGRLLPYDGLPRPTWAGAHLVETAIIVGSPSGGAAMAIDRLVSGVPGNPVHRPYGPVLMGSFPSGYQLLPRTRHDPVVAGTGTPVDPLDPDFWMSRDVGLCASWLDVDRARAMPGADTPAARRDVAEDHMRKCLRNARFFQEAMDVAMPAKPPHLGLHLFVGDAQKTPERVRIDRGDRKVRVVQRGPGDGTVLRRSALLDEAGDGADPERVRSPIPWDSVTRLGSGHLGLMSDPILLAALPGLLGREVG